MNRNIMFALAGGLAVGALVGYFFGASSQREAGPVVAAPTAAAPIMPAPSLGGAVAPGTPGGMPGAVLPNAETQNRMARLQAMVAADPKNHDAWVSLGNDYFDTHQPQKSVEAYAKALALKPEDPNVLTDQGVMYRQLNQFDKAVANFQKAAKLDPTHVQSLFNLGVVYAHDLQKPDEATKAWNKVLVLAPNSEQAAQARQQLSQLKK
ncbi:tetratricopeptide repeat protein [Geothrix sp.]|uniref:tetratricopeptide repeat protein n=1 Tax=Geothrix sp. TaxID=1962974 RepID=UPI0025BF14B2|nr:tetratricopeptide repeat protein [Geothrix sp.]